MDAAFGVPEGQNNKTKKCSFWLNNTFLAIVDTWSIGDRPTH